jgi:hypothetical protein
MISAHEIAHGYYPQSALPLAADTSITCKQYADQHVLNEGNSAMAEFELLYRVCLSGNQVDCEGLTNYQIGFYGVDNYNTGLDIMNRYRDGAITKDQANVEFGALYAARFRPSVAVDLTYYQYYEYDCECQRGNTAFCRPPTANQVATPAPCECGA